jgi:hypothetical protein
MQLISYVKTVTNKQLLISKSHGDLNLCTPYMGKSDTHDTYTSRASPHMPHVRFLWAVYIHCNLSLVINSIGWNLLLPTKRAPDIIPNTLADWSTGPPPSFFFKTAIEVVMEVKHRLTTCYISLLGQHQHAIGTFNTCSWRLIHWSLIDTSGWYHLGDANLSYYTLWPSQPTVLRFLPKGPSRSPN